MHSESRRIFALVAALKGWLNCSIEELAVLSGCPTPAKTLWRWLQDPNCWTIERAMAFMQYASIEWSIPVSALTGFIRDAHACTARLHDQLALSPWHLNKDSLAKLLDLTVEQELESTAWIYVGNIPPLCLFPDRPMRKYLRHQMGTSSKLLVDHLIAYFYYWREDLMVSSARGDRLLILPHNTLQDLKQGRGIFSCYRDQETRYDLLTSLVFDIAHERRTRVIEVAPELLRETEEFADLQEPGTFVAFTPSFFLKRVGSRLPILAARTDRSEWGADLQARYRAAVASIVTRGGNDVDLNRLAA